MMDADAFLDLAIRLSASSSEASLRTSVGRSYYGAFHAAREFVERCGVGLPRSAEAHKKLQYCLRQCEDAAVTETAAKLESLRDHRNEADYDLMTTRFQNPAVAAVQLGVAREIIDAIAQCDMDQLAPNIRDVAHALGLTVRSDGPD